MSGPDLIQCGVCLQWVSAEHDHDCQGAAPSAATDTPRTDSTEGSAPGSVVCCDELAELARQLERDLAASQQRCERLEKALEVTAIKSYNIGTLRGHEDTVEGSFVCIHPQDLATYNEDIVKEMLADGSLSEAKQALTKEPRT